MEHEQRASTAQRLRFLLTPRWIILLISVAVFAVACFMILAPWQFDRSAERSEVNDAIAAAMAEPVVPVTAVLSADRPPHPDDTWRQVEATGSFVPDGQVYIRLRQDSGGQPAYEVVAPFLLDDGGTLLVDRGYIPYLTIQNQQPVPPLPTGTVTISGRVQPDQVDPGHRGQAPAPDGTPTHTAVASGLVNGPGPVLQGFVQLLPDSPGVLDPVAVPQQDPGPFFSYAVQWLIFGIIALIGIGYFIYREFTDPAEEAIYVDEPDEPRSPPVDIPRRRSGSRRLRLQRHPRFDKSELYDS